VNTTTLIAKNTFYQIFSKILTSLIGLLTRKLLTNYLGPAGFGDYVFALTYSSLFGSIADWGTLVIGVREASKNPRSRPAIFGASLIARLILSLIAFLAAIIVFPLLGIRDLPFPVIVLSGVLIIVFALKASFGIIFETLLRMDRWLLVEVSASIFTLILFLFTVLFHGSLIFFFISLLIATLLSCLGALWLSRKLTPISLTFSPSVIKKLLIEALPMGVALIMFTVYNRIDTIILRHYRSPSEVGFYGLAYFIYENIILVAAYVINSAFPLLSRTGSDLGERDNYRRIYQKTFDLLLVLGIGAVVTTYLLSPFLVRIISSPEFIYSSTLLQILSFSLLFAFLNHATGFGLIALGKQRPYTIATLTALFFNISLNLIFVPRYGAIACAIITIGTELTVHLVSLLITYKYFQFVPSWISFPRTLISTFHRYVRH
jgi:O-antigen/teichoic acid export membrane protein